VYIDALTNIFLKGVNTFITYFPYFLTDLHEIWYQIGTHRCPAFKNFVKIGVMEGHTSLTGLNGITRTRDALKIKNALAKFT
jgi:hypothetical protein